MVCKAEAGRYNKMTAEIVECSEVDADLVMLCRTSKCTADADCYPCRLKQTITCIKSVGFAVDAWCIDLYGTLCVLCYRQDRI